MENKLTQFVLFLSFTFSFCFMLPTDIQEKIINEIAKLEKVCKRSHLNDNWPYIFEDNDSSIKKTSGLYADRSGLIFDPDPGLESSLFTKCPITHSQAIYPGSYSRSPPFLICSWFHNLFPECFIGIQDTDSDGASVKQIRIRAALARNFHGLVFQRH